MSITPVSTTRRRLGGRFAALSALAMWMRMFLIAWAIRLKWTPVWRRDCVLAQCDVGLVDQFARLNLASKALLASQGAFCNLHELPLDEAEDLLLGRAVTVQLPASQERRGMAKLPSASPCQTGSETQPRPPSSVEGAGIWLAKGQSLVDFWHFGWSSPHRGQESACCDTGGGTLSASKNAPFSLCAVWRFWQALRAAAAGLE